MRKIEFYQRPLLLQGPVGPFFHRFAGFLARRGAEVYKIHLNAGDRLFYWHPRAYAYRGDFTAWPGYLADFLRAHGIQAVYLFNDCRPYHQEAVKVAKELGIPVYVFEEGYVRPNFITLEREGVNGFSEIKDRWRAVSEMVQPRAIRGRRVATGIFWRMLYAALYYAAEGLGRRFYPHYRHHRIFHWWPEARAVLLGAWRRRYYRFTEWRGVGNPIRSFGGRYFLVALQVQGDTQIVFHSEYPNIETFLVEVLHSYASVRTRAHLVIKQHPMDLGKNDYAPLVASLAEELGIADRVHYLHEGDLHVLLRYARGVVVINSTVGTSALGLGVPVKTLGEAMYDLPGITYQGSLSSFWRSPKRPSLDLYAKFQGFVCLETQVNGSFYGTFPMSWRK